jgi:hypothetical protein
MISDAPAALDIPPLARAAGTIALPGSKSISNRVLLLSPIVGWRDARGGTSGCRRTSTACTTRW